MKNFLAGFFRENTAESMTRLCFFLSVMTSIMLSWGAVILYWQTGKDIFGQITVLAGMFLGAGTTAKLAQKGKENGNS